MRVLVDIRHLTRPQPSGVGEYTRELLEAIFRLEQRYDYTLLSTGRHAPSPVFSPLNVEGQRYAHRPTPNTLQVPNIHHLHIPIPNKILHASMVLRHDPTITKLAGGRPDLLFLPNLNIAPIPPELPYVLTVHDLSWRLFPHFFSRRMRLWHRLTRPERLITHARAIITPSHATREDLLRLFPFAPERVHVIAHGVADMFHPTFETRDHGVRSRYKLPKRFVVFLGTIEPRKNLLTTLAAIASYRAQSRDNMHLVVVGGNGWNTRPIRKRFAEPDVRVWTHLIGAVPAEDRPAILRSAQALVWPSLYEGFGLPILEAMACGTPVITSLVASLPEVGGDAALYIDPTNPHDVTMALHSLVQSPTLRALLREKGFAQAKNFSWNTSAKKTIEVFEKALH